jgi:hypothetical protein
MTVVPQKMFKIFEFYKKGAYYTPDLSWGLMVYNFAKMSSSAI